MENKSFYTSKTLWVNVVAIIAIVVQAVTGKELLDIEAQAIILGAINLILRLVTKQPVGW